MKTQPRQRISNNYNTLYLYRSTVYTGSKIKRFHDLRLTVLDKEATVSLLKKISVATFKFVENLNPLLVD